MNMSKRVLVSFLFVVCSLFIFSINVFAADCNKYGCATCVYSDTSYNFKFVLESDGNGSSNLNFSYELINNEGIFAGSYDFKHSLVARNFITKDNKLSCPTKLFQKKSSGMRNNRAFTTVLISDTEQKDYGEITLNEKMSTNNNLTVSSSSSASRACTYNTMVGNSTPVKLTVTVVNGALKYELPNGYVMNNNQNNLLSVSDFSGDECPAVGLNCGCSGSNCYCTLSKSDGSYWGERAEQTGTEEQNSNEKNDKDAYDTNIKCSDKDEETCNFYQHCIWDSANDKCIDGFVAGDPCSENSIRRVLKIFGFILLVAKIAVPLVIIGFGTFDLFKAVVDKDEKSFGKQIKQLLIRILAGLVVFFIPNIINSVFSLSNKFNIIEDDKYATCRSCVLDPTNEAGCETTSEN